MRHPLRFSTIPKANSGRSCSSPAGQASNAVGPWPFPHPRARFARRPRSRLLAKCSWATIGLSALPTLAHRVQIRQHHIPQDRLHCEVGQQPVKCRLRCGFVHLVHCSCKGTRFIDRTSASSDCLGVRSGRGCVILADRGARCLGGGQTASEMGLHAPDAALVVLGVQAEAAR